MSICNPREPHPTPTAKRAGQVDAICDDFEAAWQAGDQPLIEDYLARVEEALRDQLLAELLLAEIDLRITEGVQPDRDDYLKRFPDQVSLVDRAILQVNQSVHCDESDTTGGVQHRPKRETSAGSGALRIRCPHCHQPIEIVADAPLDNVTCNSCGSHFSLIPNEAETRVDSKISTIGHFELIERVGVGGFGTVWKAYDDELDRTVAVKIPRRGHLSPNEIGQFLREARAAAQLNHPNIVSIHEVGRDDDTVYIVTDLVPGISLADRLTGQAFTATEAAELCGTIADALHHAHEAGIVHRDLKPHNIMLDAEGAPHLMDFGLARREAGEITMTIDGQVLGTPSYMSPEQAQGEAHGADRRTDIYSLGVILFELLTGELPFRGNSRMLIQQVIRDQPPAPRGLNQSIPRDLETICLKCLEKDPQRRYGTAQELAAEFRRYLAGRPILARPIRGHERAWRWARRNPVVATLSTTVVLLLLLLAVAGLLTAMVQTRLAERYRQLLYLSDMAAARDAYYGKEIRHAIELLERHIPEPSQTDLRRFEWYHLWGLCQRSRRIPSLNVGRKASVLRISPDGRMLAVGGEGTLQLWDLESRTLLAQLPEELNGCNRLAFSSDGRWLASAVYWNETIELWDVAQRALKHRLVGHTDGVVEAAFTEDNQTLVAVSKAGQVFRWDVEAGQCAAVVDLESPEPLGEHDAHAIRPVFLSLKHRIVATGTRGPGVALSPDAGDQQRGEVVIWNLDTGQRRGNPLIHGSAVMSLTLSPDGQYLLSATRDMKTWDLATGQHLRSIGTNLVFGKHDQVIFDMAFSGDGNLLATASRDGTVRLWDFATGDLLDTLRGHDHPVMSVVFSPDGNWLITGALEPHVRLWDIRDLRNPRLPKAQRQLRVHKTAVGQIAFCPTKNIVASGTWAPAELKLWEADTGKVIHEFPGFAPSGRALVFSPDGEEFAWAANDGTIRVHDTQSGDELHVLPASARQIWLSFAPDGNTLAVATNDKFIKLWDLRDGSLVDGPTGFVETVPCVDYSPLTSERKLAVASGKSLTIWDLEQNAPVLESIVPGDKPIDTIAFSPNGQLIAAAHRGDDEFKILSARTGRVVREFGKHGSNAGSLAGLAWSADSQLVVTSGWSGNVNLWNVTAGQRQFRFPTLPRPVWCVNFSPDGRTIGIGWSQITLFHAMPESDVQPSRVRQ